MKKIIGSTPTCKKFLRLIYQKFRRAIKPVTIHIAAGLLSDLCRSKADLLVENAILRQQLIVLRRQIKRPKLTNHDRLRLILLSRFTKFWPQALHIIQPETLLRWHRGLFQLFWRFKSRNRRKEPRIPLETIRVLRQMIQENRLWGAERIRGELLKLGIRLCKRTIQKYLNRVKKLPIQNQNWATFLRNHSADIWACDFTTVYDWLFRSQYIFVIMELKKRRILHIATTENPTDEWATQQLREATTLGKKPKYLIRDRDSKFGSLFNRLAICTGITILKTPFHAPQANAFCERFIGSLRRECLDHFVFFNRHHVNWVTKEYVTYFNGHRPHQGIGQLVPSEAEGRIPNLIENSPRNNYGKIRTAVFLGGLHHSYSRENAPP